MNIQELQSERDALQKRLRTLVQPELDKFKNTTGVYVDSVNVYLGRYCELGVAKPVYFTEEVRVTLDL